MYEKKKPDGLELVLHAPPEGLDGLVAARLLLASAIIARANQNSVSVEVWPRIDLSESSCTRCARIGMNNEWLRLREKTDSNFTGLGLEVPGVLAEVFLDDVGRVALLSGLFVEHQRALAQLLGRVLVERLAQAFSVPVWVGFDKGVVARALLVANPARPLHCTRQSEFSVSGDVWLKVVLSESSCARCTRLGMNGWLRLRKKADSILFSAI